MKTLTLIALLFSASARCAAQGAGPVDNVNTLIGTTGPAGVTNYGGVCPWVTTPHGMTNWTPSTQENDISVLPFRFEQKAIQGFMGSHQPTVWMSDYGFITLMPEVGTPRIRPADRAMRIQPNSQIAKPYYYAVTLGDTGGQAIRVEMTATSRCGMFRLAFRGAPESHMFVELSRTPGYTGWVRVSPDRREIEGYNPGRQNLFNGREMGPPLKNFRGYFIIRFEKPFTAFSVWTDTGNVALYPGRAELTGARVGAVVSFPANPSEKALMKIGSSFISLDQARDNLRKEIPGWDFDAVAGQTRQQWNNALNRIRIFGGTPDQRTIFYTALYHTLVFPRRFDEYGRYYSAFDDRIHEGISYNDFSMWDTFRALHPLLTLTDPEDVSAMVRSLVQMYKEGGWIPKWPNPSYTNIMIGTPADAIIADAYVKGFRDYDLTTAYEALVKDATTPPEGDTLKRWADRARWTSYEAREGLTYYQRLGYVPADRTDESVSCTLEFAFEDYCVAQMAKGLGKDADERFFMARSKNYRNLYDPHARFMMPRLSDGSFFRGDPERYRAFTEGSPWTYLFCVMHDVPGLVQLMGPEVFTARLDSNFAGGHFAYDNEPENHYPYLYDWVNQTWKTDSIVTRVMEDNYRNAPDGITGNDDCGQMSAWYVFSALGFYPVCPASGEYAIGRPFFEKIEVDLTYPVRNTLTIRAKNLTPGNIYVKSVKLDGRSLPGPFLKHDGLFSHKLLEFEMDSTPGTILTQPGKARTMKKVTGIGGIFFKCKDPDRMKAWYQEHLGLDTTQYGAVFEWYQAPDGSKKGLTTWSPFKETTKYFEPSTKDFMINYRVENLEGLVEDLRKSGVTIVDTIETYDYGKFVHILDAEGNKVELWEPKDSKEEK